MSPEFADRIEGEKPWLIGFLRREAAGLLRFENEDDLYQALHLRALEAAQRFEDRGEESFRAWLTLLARRCISDRRDYWNALKRDSAQVVRLSVSSSNGASKSPGSSWIEDLGPGPVTWASRRELLIVATKALSVLGERDRELITGHLAGKSLEELGEGSDLGSESLRKARDRALERLRKAFVILNSRRS